MASIEMFDLVGGFSGVSTTSNHMTVDSTCSVRNHDPSQEDNQKGHEKDSQSLTFTAGHLDNVQLDSIEFCLRRIPRVCGGICSYRRDRG